MSNLMGHHTITIDESQRQAILLALAHLALARPGWNMMLSEIAAKMDNPDLELYELFKHHCTTPFSPTIPSNSPQERSGGITMPPQGSE